MFTFSNMHHVGIGVKDLTKMKTFYKEILRFNLVHGEFPNIEHEAMREVVRRPQVFFEGIIFGQKAGGVMVELVHMTDPVPRPIRPDFRYGDIGVAKMTIAVSDLNAFYIQMKSSLNFCFDPKKVSLPDWRDYHFIYCKDPEGNLIEFISSEEIKVNSRLRGIRWVGVSVTDLPRSVLFYQENFGFDVMVVKPHDKFSGTLDEITGFKKTRVRSCILKNSKADTMIELFEVSNPRGRSIPILTNFGDFGYLQFCTLCDNVNELEAFFDKKKIEFLCRKTIMDAGIPEHPGAFIYVKDPDGIPAEFLHLPELTA